MKSHEHAQKIKQAAEYILSCPEFETEASPMLYAGWYWEKDKFVNAVKALGSGKKEFFGTDLRYTVENHGAKIYLTIPRDKVCRKVQEVKWECEPLFSAEELEKI